MIAERERGNSELQTLDNAPLAAMASDAYIGATYNEGTPTEYLLPATPTSTTPAGAPKGHNALWRAKYFRPNSYEQLGHGVANTNIGGITFGYRVC